MEILEIIKKKYPQIKNNLSWSNWFEYLNFYYQEETNYFLHQLNIAPAPLVPIQPGNIFFNLDNSICESDSQNLIDIEQDYLVFDKYLNFQYQVSNHQGYFGNSILDKLLVINGEILDFFYLQFTLKNKENKIITLFLNKI